MLSWSVHELRYLGASSTPYEGHKYVCSRTHCKGLHDDRWQYTCMRLGGWDVVGHIFNSSVLMVSDPTSFVHRKAYQPYMPVL